MKTAADTTLTTDPATLGPLIRVGTAAALLNASGRKVRDMCVKGEIKAVKVGSDWRINTAAFLEQFGI
jgi:excisionase family DNA binding protein